MIDVRGIQPGMDVYDASGDKIGSVASVDATAQGGSGLDTGGVIDVDAGTTPNTYVTVTGDRTLWVPVNQITDTDPDRGITLACDAGSCREHYSLRPPGLPDTASE